MSSEQSLSEKIRMCGAYLYIKKIHNDFLFGIYLYIYIKISLQSDSNRKIGLRSSRKFKIQY